MAVIQISKIQVRRGQENQTGIPQLEPGEFGWAEDTEHLYIGKRISEGASSDENTRILTENDLNYFRLLAVNNTSTAASTYEYRNGIITGTTVISIQDKLDSLNPSLTDFIEVPLPANTYLPVDDYLRDAIRNIFNNDDPTVRNDRRRVLELPAGLFSLENRVELPPYTKLRGAGQGLTTLRYVNVDPSQPMFVTVDSQWMDYNEGMNLTTGSSVDILLEDMTIEFDSNTVSSSTVLLSIDNTAKAQIRNCKFQASGGVIGPTDTGIAIRVRGTATDTTSACRDIVIENCDFENFGDAVVVEGVVLSPAIRSSRFKNLNHGVKFSPNGLTPGPVGGQIAYNRFEDIRYEAILVENNPDGTPSSALSTQNYFARCGGVALNEFTTTSSTTTSVIGFFSQGNKTVDDVFARRDKAMNFINSTTFYYAPFVKGSTTVADSAVYTTTVTNLTINSGDNIYAIVPLNGGNQVATVNYQLYNDIQSRKGTVIANITPNGSVAITDTYNYIETLAEDTRFITASTGSGVNILLLDTSTNVRFADVQNTIGTWYLTGEGEYAGKSAYIVDVITSGTVYVVQTDSSNPTFDFATTGTWTLLTSKTTDVLAFYDNSKADSNNFVALTMLNGSPDLDFTLDFQINIQT